jgi:hypothetical protein
MAPHPKTLVGTTPHSVEAAFRVLGRGGKARALKIARKAQQALAEADQPPSDGIANLVRQLEKAELDEQAIGILEAIGLRAVERMKPLLDAAKKNGIDFARALEESVIADERAETQAAKDEKAAAAENAKKAPPKPPTSPATTPPAPPAPKA